MPDVGAEGGQVDLVFIMWIDHRPMTPVEVIAFHGMPSGTVVVAEVGGMVEGDEADPSGFSRIDGGCVNVGLRIEILPPAQAALEADYKTQLAKQFGIVFDSLITITNMPIARFRHDLSRAGQLDDYHALLVASFNPATLEGLMCRSLISVSWEGQLHDCDFNQMLDIPLGAAAPQTIWELPDLDSLSGRSVRTEAHCFGCTAGAGSSCSGSTA
ncbi:MAG TPA: DUF3641 domain-containing protein [Candidatus Handelsmanbacteria bacterium]|nr:DUF3641 domain-containing protein [Candidatus Handelsmanbacteria bacterium]